MYQNQNQNTEITNLKNKINELELYNSQLIQQIPIYQNQNQNTEIPNLKNKINELESYNFQLIQQISMYKNQDTEISNLKNKINELESYNFQLIQQNGTPWYNNKFMQINPQLNQNNKPFEIIECDSLNFGENLIAINISSGDGIVNFHAVCKSNTKFVDLEKKLYEKYQKYQQNGGNGNIFLCWGKTINRFLTMEQNGLFVNSVVLMENNY